MNQSGIAPQEVAINGARYLPGFLSPSLQRLLIEHIHQIIKVAPLFQPTMPRTGKAFSVCMTNCGPLGWVSDQRGGYRYQPNHPVTGDPWPALPHELITCWRQLTDYAEDPGSHDPQACLINFYDTSARMGLHRDQDEVDMTAPVVSLSLGDAAKFRIGGKTRNTATKSFKLNSGDALVLQGGSRLAFHGVDKILVGSSTLLENAFGPARRINLTLRRVT